MHPTNPLWLSTQLLLPPTPSSHSLLDRHGLHTRGTKARERMKEDILKDILTLYPSECCMQLRDGDALIHYPKDVG